MTADHSQHNDAITSSRQAPSRTVTAGGVTYAYRELGPKRGIPVIFFVHLAATLDRASSTRSHGNITLSPSTTAA